MIAFFLFLRGCLLVNSNLLKLLYFFFQAALLPMVIIILLALNQRMSSQG